MSPYGFTILVSSIVELEHIKIEEHWKTDSKTPVLHYIYCKDEKNTLNFLLLHK